MAPAEEALQEQELLRVAPPRPATPTKRKRAAVKPEMNRQERLISTAYLAMIVLVVPFLAVTGLVAWLSA
jgi:hypothetical protein